MQLSVTKEPYLVCITKYLVYINIFGDDSECMRCKGCLVLKARVLFVNFCLGSGV